MNREGHPKAECLRLATNFLISNETDSLGLIVGVFWQRQAVLSPNFETRCDGLLKVRERSLARFALADAAGNGWAFSDPDAIFIPVQSARKLMEFSLSFPSRFGSAAGSGVF